MSTDLHGKTVLVTGGAGGLGKAIATKYLSAGANVAICDINAQRLDEAATELAATGSSGRVKAIQADITSSTEAQRLVDEVIVEFGKLDILINNAGIMDRFDPVGELDEGLWEKVMAVNLTAPFLLSKLAVRNMLVQEEGVRDGCIVNIVSVAGKAGWAAGAAYTASKHGLVGLTKNTASFYGNQGIRCNALMLGGMDTNIVEAFQSGINATGFGKARKIMEAVQVPLCQLDQAADVCLSLTCGRGSKLINGACIPVDQGWTGIVG